MSKLKTFIVLPHDAFELLEQLYDTEPEAVEAAKVACGEGGQRHYVLKVVADVSREIPPVKVRRL